ncbi:hypothetical protein BLOT_009472 [Blomia tropicalis]|nr:hypothetical protein BLOT_009472 [Blomia tropicalis]
MDNSSRMLGLLLVFLIALSPTECFLRSKLFPKVDLANAIRDNSLHGYLDKESAESNAHLTSLIESGELEKARQLSLVKNLPGIEYQIESFAGYLTVNKTFNSNLFFWFFPALVEAPNVPVLLWLQGGPGGSSLFGLFVENGPFIITEDVQVLFRNYTWNRDFAVLYIDNPVGTGFSYTDNDAGFARNEDDVARDLYEALKQFFILFEPYRGNPFFVTGESYAGKYVPAIAHKILTMKNEAKEYGINLQGIAIGDGLCDPRNMGNYGDYLYQIGLLDERERDYFNMEQSKAVQYIDNRQFYKAFQVFDYLLNGDLVNGSSYFMNSTGINFYFNFLMDRQPKDFDYYVKFLGLKQVRDAIHVGNRPYHDGSEVEKHLVNDIMNTVKPLVEDLLNSNVRTMLYSGQLDIIVAAPLTENFIQKLEWKGAGKYLRAPKKIYRVTPSDPNVAGYVRQADNLYQVIIRNAGHILPYDQPRVAYDMITRFVTEKEF